MNIIWIQHDHPTIRIPQHISRWAFVSAQLFLLESFLAYYLRYYLMSGLLLTLYCTTLLHWRKVKKTGWIRNADIAVAATTFVTITVRDCNRFLDCYRWLWYKVAAICLFAFFVNEAVLACRLNNLSRWYAAPHTWEREKAFYISTFVHMVFLHIIPVVMTAYCAIGEQ